MAMSPIHTRRPFYKLLLRLYPSFQVSQTLLQKTISYWEVFTLYNHSTQRRIAQEVHYFEKIYTSPSISNSIFRRARVLTICALHSHGAAFEKAYCYQFQQVQVPGVSLTILTPAGSRRITG